MHSTKLTLLLLICHLGTRQIPGWGGSCLLTGPPYSDMKMWVFPLKRIMISNAVGGSTI